MYGVFKPLINFFFKNLYLFMQHYEQKENYVPPKTFKDQNLSELKTHKIVLNFLQKSK